MTASATHSASLPDRRPSSFVLGEWQVEPASGSLTKEGDRQQLEPQLMTLLMLLVADAGQVVSRERIESSLWPTTVVGEDTIARAISRLRRALGDPAQSPRYIETLPKRGYRLIASVSGVADDERTMSAASVQRRYWMWLVAAALALAVGSWLVLQGEGVNGKGPDRRVDPMAMQVALADDYYMRFTRADNEAAIGLYEQVLAQQPDNTDAHAGLANALVQRVVRWPRGTNAEGVSTLTAALDQGLTRRPDAQATLARAVAMAERAVRIAPQDPVALKALGFVYTAQGDLERGAAIYEQVLSLDPNAWAAMVNLGEIAAMRGDQRVALTYLEQAWSAMARAYEYEPQRVGPWQVAFGVLIGQTHEELGQVAEAELWYRRVLAKAPYQPDATARLARLLAANGARDEANALCAALRSRVDATVDCNTQ